MHEQVTGTLPDPDRELCLAHARRYTGRDRMTTQTLPITPAQMRRGKRIRRLIFAAICLVALCFAGVLGTRLWLRHAMRAALPQIDGSLRLEGLSAPVTVTRDAHGVPSVHAQSLDDLLLAQGYVTAQDRLWQMDMLRRHAAGELAEVLGSSMVEHDRNQRYLQVRATADRDIATMPADQRHALEVYANGVNAAMTDTAAHLPAEFRLLGYKPAPWTPRDSLLVAFAMAEDLSTTFPDKLNREAVAAKLSPQPGGDQALANLYPVGSFRDHPPAEGKPDMTAPREMINIPLDESQAKLAAPEHLRDLQHTREVLALNVSGLHCEGCAAGSNNWAVSGSRSASGKPLVANDMHLQLTLPGIWYTADLQAGSFHAGGVTLPGVPLVLVGHNDHVAWSFTNSSADVQDLYVEQVNGDTFRAADGSTQPLVHQTETIRVKRGLNVTLDVKETRHGNVLTPILSPIFPHETRALALRWSLYEPDFADLPTLRADAAGNGAELVEAFRHFGGPSQNLVWGDDSGHIGYHLTGLVPLRGANGQSGISPVPVNAGTYEWTGFIPYDTAPAVTDPSGGILATANARITPDNYPYAVALDWELPYRNERIWKALGDRTGLTADDMTALQNDTFSALDKTIAERVAYAVDHAKKPSSRAREAADILRAWDGRVGRNSVAPNITQGVRIALLPMLVQPKLGDVWTLYTWRERSYAIEMILERGGERWLPREYPDWNELLTAALERGLKESHAPGKLQTWTWAKTHTLQLHHPIFGSSWALRRLSGDPRTTVAELPGNAFTVRVATGLHGASERFVADLANPAHATMTLPAGESGQAASPWYLDQWSTWTAGIALPLPYGSFLGATHTLTLQPR